MTILLQSNIEHLLEKYFAEYKEYHIWAIVILTLIVLGFQIGQTIIVSRKIERFKNVLKKNEIQFSKFNNLQIDALKSIYDKMVNLHYKNYALFQPETFSHESLKTRIKDWRADYLTLMDVFHREKLLLPKDLKLKIKNFETNFNLISKRLNEETLNLNDVEEDIGSSNAQDIYNSPEDELERIQNRIERLNNDEEIKKSNESISGLRKSVENYFESLTE
ncbi:hypothetical protein [Olleya sp. ITB9]|uniref:hypothetical protein n=1 Tax=Olleya sp. ITB9 TaxID=1715648 RepID=UPI0006CF7FDF|nr:hypothetical protein [Olleya sp. ITB9]